MSEYPARIPSKCQVDIQPEPVVLTDGELGTACMTVTFRNDGDTLAIVLRATIRLCVRFRVAGHQQRICFSMRHSVQLELDGKCLEQIEIPVGESVVFKACTSLGQQIEDVENTEIEIEIHEQHGDLKLVRSISVPIAECV